MLGLRCVFKEDIKATAAEMVYGQTLRLPSDFFTEKPAVGNEAEFVKKFRIAMRKVRPTQTAHHTNEKPFVHKKLKTSEQVFVKDDTVLAPLQPPYVGPFQVLSRNEKTYKINLKGKPKNVSIDRLKPAFIENAAKATTKLQTNQNNRQTPAIKQQQKSLQPITQIQRPMSTIALLLLDQEEKFAFQIVYVSTRHRLAGGLV